MINHIKTLMRQRAIYTAQLSSNKRDLENYRDALLIKGAKTIYGLNPGNKIQGIKAIHEVADISVEDAKVLWELGELLAKDTLANQQGGNKNENGD